MRIFCVQIRQTKNISMQFIRLHTRAPFSKKNFLIATRANAIQINLNICSHSRSGTCRIGTFAYNEAKNVSQNVHFPWLCIHTAVCAITLYIMGGRSKERHRILFSFNCCWFGRVCNDVYVCVCEHPTTWGMHCSVEAFIIIFTKWDGRETEKRSSKCISMQFSHKIFI